MRSLRQIVSGKQTRKQASFGRRQLKRGCEQLGVITSILLVADKDCRDGERLQLILEFGSGERQHLSHDGRGIVLRQIDSPPSRSDLNVCARGELQGCAQFLTRRRPHSLIVL